MITDLKPYAEYKESGIPWLGQVPVHWELRKVREVAAVINGYPFDSKRFSLSDGHPLIRIRDLNKSRTATRYSGVFIECARVYAGDLLIGMDGDFNLGTWLGDEPALLNQRMCCVRARNPLMTKFLRFAIPRPLRQINDVTYATTVKHLSSGQVERIIFGAPSVKEQAAIVRFLDWANGRLERSIRAKRKVIALLNEQKQAIIHRAVTRGIDPSVPLKDSGVPWLGKIPAHWEVRRLRHLIKGRLTYGANAAAEFTNPDWPRYIRITDFRADGSLKADTFRSLPPSVASDYMVSPGDVLFARSGATVGKAFLVQTLTGAACHAGYLICARPDRSLVCPEYLFAFTQSKAFSDWKDSTFNTATIQNIGADKYANLPVPLPILAAQWAILESMTSEQQPILATISRLEREITLLREYRTRLVDDVVTGKLDVRDAAAALPEEEPIAEVTGLPDLDDDFVDNEDSHDSEMYE